MQTATKVHHESPHGNLTLRSHDENEAEAARVPMFRSIEAALLFAYTWRARPGVKAATYGEFTGPDGAELLLTVHEKKTQAQYVHYVLESHLSLDQRALLDATHGGEYGERYAAIERLLCQFEGVHRNRMLIRMLLMREFIFGESYCPSQNRIARECGVNAMAASRAAAVLTPEIIKLRERTHEKLRPAFERRGWIARGDRQ